MKNKISVLSKNKSFLKYFKNISWLFMEKVIRMVVGFFIGVWIARYLGPEDFGLFAYAQSFIGLYVLLAKFGLDSVVIRELVINKQNNDALIGTVFFLKFFGFLLVVILLFISMQFTSNDDYTNLLIFIISGSIMFQSFNVIDFYFQSKVLSKYIVLVNMLSLFLSSVLKIILILNEAPLIYFALVVLFDSIIVALGLVYMYIQKTSLRIQAWKFNKILAKRLLRDSWPLIISGVNIAIYIQIDQIMIKEMLSNAANGQYAVAARLNSIWYFVPVIISSSLFPAIIKAKQKNEKLYYARLQKLYRLILVIAISVVVPISLFADWIVDFIYGEQYNRSSAVLIILIWTGFAVALSTVWKRWIINENRQVIILYVSIFGILINIILNIFFIEFYGINGAAIATLFTLWISTFFGYSLYKASIAYTLFFNSFNFLKFFNDKGKL